MCHFFLIVLAFVLLQPFGVNQPGPYVMYTTVDSNGYLKNASGKYFLFLNKSMVAFTSNTSNFFFLYINEKIVYMPQ